MAYVPRLDWKNLPDRSTPVTASDLIRIEQGIADASANNGGGPVAAADITDSTAVGRDVLTAADAQAARDAIGVTAKPAGGWTSADVNFANQFPSWAGYSDFASYDSQIQQDMANTASFVRVVTGDEARPTGDALILWVGGTTRPANMAAGDLWFKADSETGPVKVVSSVESAFNFSEGTGNAVSHWGSYALAPDSAESWGAAGVASSGFTGPLGPGAVPDWWFSIDITLNAYPTGGKWASILYVPDSALWFDFPDGTQTVLSAGGSITTGGIPLGQKINLIVAHEGGTTAGANITRIYRDGVLDVEVTHPETFSTLDWSGQVQVGDGAEDDPLDGTFDNVRFGVGTITDQQAQTIAATPVA